MADSTAAGGSLPLDQYTKTTPPGWKPGNARYPLRSFFQRVRLWYRVTDMHPNQLGPAAAGRLIGRPFIMATTMTIMTHEGVQLRGDAALAYAGEAAHPDGRAPVPSGLEQLFTLLQERFGAEEQATSITAIGHFEQFTRTYGMSTLGFVNDWDLRLDQAQSLAGYQIGAVALSNRLLKAAPLPRDRQEAILDKVDRDLNRFDEIHGHVTRLGKSSVDVGLLAHAAGHDRPDHYYVYRRHVSGIIGL